MGPLHPHGPARGRAGWGARPGGGADSTPGTGGQTGTFATVRARTQDLVVNGEKQQTTRRRADPRIEAGTIVRADVIQFADLEITDVIRKRLGELTEEDAREEGDYTLDEFRDLWRRSYGSWNPDELVTIIKFQVARVL